MTFTDLIPELSEKLPRLQGRLKANASLSEITWFRVGGPAQLLFTPSDESDLAYFLKNLPSNLPLTVIGLGSRRKFSTMRAAIEAIGDG